MDENQNIQTEQTEQKPVEQVQEREYSPIELKAIEQGWIPKEEFDGDEEAFIDAPEFVRRGELFSKIERTSKELKQVRAALEALSEHHSKVKEMEYERALKSLKDARRQATIEGDHERALALEDKIDEVKLEKESLTKDVVKIAEPDGYTPQFQRWVDRNNWYETNRTMRATADALGKDFHNQGYGPEEVLDMVEQEIRKEFAHKFKNPAANRPSAVEATTRSGSKKDDFVLSPEEREIMRKIVSVTPGYSEADYIKELKALKNR